MREILKYFCLGLEAVKVTKLSSVSKKTIDKIFKQLRILMLQECEKLAKFPNKIHWRNRNRVRVILEQKQSRGKRGRGVGKSILIEATPVFGMLKREGKVYT